jgi:hypothetical protein
MSFFSKRTSINNNEFEIINEIYRLESKFIITRYMHIETHGSNCHCCISAFTCLKSAIINSAQNYGISGVLEYLQNNFTWGYYQCKSITISKLQC